MIRQPNRTPITALQLGEQIEPDLFRRTRVGRGALQHRQWSAGRLDGRNRLVEILPRRHATGDQHGPPGRGHPRQHRQIGHFAGTDFPGRHGQPIEQFHGLDRERSREENQSALSGMIDQALPLKLAELHAFPVVIARGVLRRKLDAKGLAAGRFGRRDVRLKLNGIGAGPGHGVDIGVRGAEAAVVGLCHFGDHEAWPAGADFILEYREVHAGGRFACDCDRIATFS